MLCSCLIPYSNRVGKKFKGSCFISSVVVFVLFRVSLLKDSAWDDYQEWLQWKGVGLLTFSSGERAI